MIGRTLLALLLSAPAAPAADITLIARKHDPYGTPRPARNQKHVPLRSTLYFELGVAEKGSTDPVLAETVTVELQPDGGPAFAVLAADRKFADGYSGRFLPVSKSGGGPVLAVYVESARPLRPLTAYSIRVTARTRDGLTLPEKTGSWRFTTEAAPEPVPLEFDLNLADKPVRWHGGFFTGFCNVSFATSHQHRIPTYDLMTEVRKSSPRAWTLQRDFWLTGMEHRRELLARHLPNIVRERETRHVTAMTKHADGTQLTVEDFFGHEQYGIPSNRPASDDYHPGDEVLVVDGVNSGRAKVVRADARTVLLAGLKEPAGGWKLAYDGPLPKQESSDTPGLFPPGGCHLIKFKPHGTPAYYWGRLDREWDLAHRTYGRRVMPNFADAPGDIARDGLPWTTAKDYAQLHEVTREIAGHIIDRYGAAALTFPWSVFNEPDLGALFWRADWDELQRFYDYTSDAVLRAFEDRGYDSNEVFIGGLELGGIFGTNLRLREFLVHCSPRAAPVKGARPLNAAYADKRLDGKRSKRVEALCRANAGRGAPCDFISIHAYNSSKLMADKLARARELALEIDAEHYAKLWVNSHEACPGWMPPADPAYADSYLGNGYYPTWCADVAVRQLRKAAADPRYGYGESILTVWPWPARNFEGINDTTRAIRTDDGKSVTVAMPILHFLGLLARLGPDYHVLPEQTVGGHIVSGIASRDGETVRALFYSHNALDTESRSDAAFDLSLRLDGLPPGKLTVTEYRFDREHNSYFRLGREQRDRPKERSVPARDQLLRQALRDMDSDRAETQLAGLKRLAELGPAAASSAGAVFQLFIRATDNAVKEQAGETLKKLTAPATYSSEVVKKVEELSALRPTGTSTPERGGPIKVRIAGNGAAVLEIRPAGE